jgi:CBS domain-containing protein
MSTAPPHAGVPGAAARGIPSVHALTTVREATHLMTSRGVLHVHVEDSLGNVVGVLTVSDLYRWVAAAQTADDDDGPTAGHA